MRKNRAKRVRAWNELDAEEGFKGERDMMENSSRVKIIGDESKFEFVRK